MDSAQYSDRTNELDGWYKMLCMAASKYNVWGDRMRQQPA